MKGRKTILFFILELIFGFGFGILGTLLVTPKKPKFDLNLSIIIGFFTICLFALIGIGIIGFFHSRMIKGRYWVGIINAFLFLILGLIIGAVLSSLFYFLPYRISSFYIPILTPILCGVIGFNVGFNPRIRLNEK